MQDASNTDIVVDLVVEQCAHCGHSVKWGSGRFVNRVTIIDRDDNQYPHAGDFICEECDAMDSDTV